MWHSLPTTTETRASHVELGRQKTPALATSQSCCLLSLGHMLWRAFVWWSCDVMEMAWPIPRLDIGNKRAGRHMREKGKQEYLLWSQQIHSC